MLIKGIIDEDFLELLNVNWKIVVVTRSDMSGTGYDSLEIKELIILYL